MKKRRQHYVWKKYLLPWTDGGKIWCRRRGQYPFQTNPINVLVERDFYKVDSLTKNDVIFIYKLAIEPIKNPELKKLNEGWVDMYNTLFDVETKVRKNDQLCDASIEEFEQIMHNMDENFHCGLENAGEKFIDSLLDEDTSFYSDSKMASDFSYYLANQYFRTKKLKDNILSGFDKVKVDGVSYERIWPILRHIFSTNVAFSIYANRHEYKLVMLVNDSDMNFITSDQPVVNTYSLDSPSNGVVDDVEFYYPVSPKLSVIISKENIYSNEKKVKLGKVGVGFYNDVVAKLSYEQVLGKTESCLDSKNIEFR